MLELSGRDVHGQLRADLLLHLFRRNLELVRVLVLLDLSWRNLQLLRVRVLFDVLGGHILLGR